MQGHGTEVRHSLEGKPEPESEEFERMRAAGCALLISMATMWN